MKIVSGAFRPHVERNNNHKIKTIGWSTPTYQIKASDNIIVRVKNQKYRTDIKA